MAYTKKPRNNKFKKQRGNVKKDFDESKAVREEHYNDPSWYVANGQLLKDVASLSFNNALGASSRVTFHPYDGDYAAQDMVYTSPGIMSIYTAPSMGISVDGSSALNLAAKNFYTWIRHQNSGHVNYDSPDLMLYFGAMDSIYSMIASMMRAYGTARAFSQVNRYIGDAMLAAMGYTPSDVRANLADFRAYINMVITKVSAFCTPVTMKMFLRHFWMYSGLYRDTNVVKSQTYMYVPATVWKYVETEGAGHLEAVKAYVAEDTSGQLTPSPKSLNQLRSFVDDLVAAVVSSEDINIMSGDILKAYGRENLWTLSMIPEDYVTFPVYSDEVVDQIHNSTFAGAIPVASLDLTTTPTISLDRLGVIQDPEVGDGSLYFAPQFLNAAQLGYDAIIDMHVDEPTPEQVIVSTRNILTGKVNTILNSSNSITTLTGAGSDIPLFAIVRTISATGYDYARLFYNQNPYSTGILSKLSVFNMYPRFITVDQGTLLPNIYGELDNYTVVSHDDIQRMHDSALLSLMGVPFLGTGSKT